MIQIIAHQYRNLVRLPERIVDPIGMYRVVTLSLVALTVCALIASATGLLAYSIAALLTSVLLALGVGLGLNIVLARVLKVSANHESSIITALILFFMMIPSVGVMGNWQLLLAVVLAVVSKYVITYRKQHIFNAAAVGAVLVTLGVGAANLLTGSSYNTDIFSWWVANPVLFWPVLILGVLIVAKVRKWTPVLAFVGVGLLVFLIEEYRFGVLSFDSIPLYLVSFPTLFLAFFMLTEPFTMPPQKKQQAWYGALVGALSSTAVFAPILAMTPELALVLGNAFAYCFRIRRKLFLKFISKREVAKDTWEFTFSKPDGFSFIAGQYVEWMLPHEQADSRGPRRYFTIASSPTESVIRLALKVMSEKGSTYKVSLMELDEGEEIVVSQLAGDFVLPRNTETKLGFIAGGIGVTPFSSQLSWMKDNDQQFDTRLYYCCNTMGELAFYDQFKRMSDSMPLVVIPVIGKEEVNPPNERGYITSEMLARRTPDYKERTWYISGPPGMVNAYKKLLRESGVPKKQIHTDFFPGLA